MNNIKDKVKAVIFDMDGTIIKTEHIWDVVSRQVLMDLCNITTLSERHKEFLKNVGSVGVKNTAIIMKREFDIPHSIEEIVQRKLQLAATYFNEAIEFIEGFEDFHKRLQTFNIPTSIATNASEVSLKQISENLKFERFFGKNMYSIADVNNRAKPDPAVFLHAAKQLSVDPYDCIVFEDSLVGFQAAKAAGMKCIAIKNKNNKDHLIHVHDAIDDYSQAEEAIKKVFLA